MAKIALISKRKHESDPLEDCIDELFVDQNKIPYVAVKRSRRNEVYKLNSDTFEAFIIDLWYGRKKQLLKKRDVKELVYQLTCRAMGERVIRDVYVRVASLNDKVYLDLCNDNWEVIEISSKGWRLLSESPVKFHRDKNALPLPYPEGGGNIENLQKLINIANSDFPLVVAWLLASLRGNGPYPILVIQGEQGSAKSTLSRFMKGLVDPSTASLLNKTPGTRDLMISAQNRHIIVFNNLSTISTRFSDDLCCLSTGGGLSIRQLYTDSGEIVFNTQKPCILNGIGDLILRSDLRDRSIIINLPPMKARKRESELNKQFEELRPSILAGLLDLLSKALFNEPKTEITDLPRMADFCHLSIAAGIDNFLPAYTENQFQSKNELLHNSSIGQAIVKLLSIENSWEGTMTKLMLELRSLATEKASGLRSTRALSNELKELSPNLRSEGIIYEPPKSNNGKRILYLTKI